MAPTIFVATKAPKASFKLFARKGKTATPASSSQDEQLPACNAALTKQSKIGALFRIHQNSTDVKTKTTEKALNVVKRVRTSIRRIFSKKSSSTVSAVETVTVSEPVLSDAVVVPSTSSPSTDVYPEGNACTIEHTAVIIPQASTISTTHSSTLHDQSLPACAVERTKKSKTEALFRLCQSSFLFMGQMPNKNVVLPDTSTIVTTACIDSDTVVMPVSTLTMDSYPEINVQAVEQTTRTSPHVSFVDTAVHAVEQTRRTSLHVSFVEPIRPSTASDEPRLTFVKVNCQKHSKMKSFFCFRQNSVKLAVKKTTKTKMILNSIQHFIRRMRTTQPMPTKSSVDTTTVFEPFSVCSVEAMPLDANTVETTACSETSESPLDLNPSVYSDPDCDSVMTSSFSFCHTPESKYGREDESFSALRISPVTPYYELDIYSPNLVAISAPVWDEDDVSEASLRFVSPTDAVNGSSPSSSDAKDLCLPESALTAHTKRFDITIPTVAGYSVTSPKTDDETQEVASISPIGSDFGSSPDKVNGEDERVFDYAPKRVGDYSPYILHGVNKRSSAVMGSFETATEKSLMTGNETVVEDVTRASTIETSAIREYAAATVLNATTQVCAMFGAMNKTVSSAFADDRMQFRLWGR